MPNAQGFSCAAAVRRSATMQARVSCNPPLAIMCAIASGSDPGDHAYTR
jgi:hypothetical protein